MNTPILFIVFNRPEETKSVFEAIRSVKPKRFYIAADGPRLNLEDDYIKCEEVKQIITNQIDWDCKVRTNFRNENLGCKKAVSSAIDWFFENEEEGIILEDDTLPDISFFPFCEELLSHYRNDSRIGMISGDNFGFGYRRNEDSYYFTRYTHIWGWASWRRSWLNYDTNLSNFKDFIDENKVIDLFSDHYEREFWKENFTKVAYEKFDTWDFQFVYHNFTNNKLNIMPAINLVTNIGFNSKATHTKEKSLYANMKIEKMIFPLRHPKFIIEDSLSSEKSKLTFLNPESKENSKFNLLLNKVTNHLRNIKNLFITYL